MALEIRKAEKRRQKLRLALFGVSGAGKTMSALRIARGLVGPSGRICVIDSENASSELYADRFQFDVLPLSEPRNGKIADLADYHPDRYSEALEMASKAGYDAVIVDSLSHGWVQLLDEVERIAKAKYRGNSWSAWSEGTPVQRRLIGNIINSPFHLIATMRSKTEWSTEEVNGRKQPVRVGMNPEQGKGIEYEFSLLGEIYPNHAMNILKDRTGKFQDRLIDKPDEIFGAELLDWLNTGAEAPAHRPLAMDDATFQKHLNAIRGLTGDRLAGAVAKINENTQYSPEQRTALLTAAEYRIAETANTGA